MKAVLSRPLFFFCAVFLLISAGASAVLPAASGAAAIALGVLAVPSAILALVKKKTFFRFAALFSAAAALACALSFFAFGVRLGAAEKYDGVTAEGTVTVTDTRYSSETFGVYTARFSDGNAAELHRRSHFKTLNALLEQRDNLHFRRTEIEEPENDEQKTDDNERENEKQPEFEFIRFHFILPFLCSRNDVLRDFHRNPALPQVRRPQECRRLSSLKIQHGPRP